MIGLLASCFEDESNTKIEKINPIHIELGDFSTTVSVYLLDTLRINPIIYKEGTDDAKLSFTWEISGNDIVPAILGTTMNLNAVITVPASADAYRLVLTATDEDTGLKNYEELRLYVMSNFGRGLLIADTKDGQNSDLNLVMSANFSATWTAFPEKNTKTMKSVFSQCNNGNLIEGLVNGMQSTSQDGMIRTLTVTTEHSAVRMDPYDYLAGKENQELFFVPVTGKFAPRGIQYDGNVYYELLNIDGTIYSRRMRESNLYYGAPLVTSDYEEYDISQMCAIPEYSYYESAYYFDEKLNRFLSSSLDHMELQTIDHSDTRVFDPNNVGEKDALFMGVGSSKNIFTLFKNEKSNDYFLYTFIPTAVISGTTFTPQHVYNLSNATGIQQAVAYECSALEEVFYYATDKKVYAALLTQDTPEAFERYSIDIDEDDPNTKITSIKLWKQNYQGKIKIKDSEAEEGYTEIYAGNRMMMITTYNEFTKEGKVICVPVMNLNSGTLEKDKSFHKVYDGFGRILYLAPQSL